MKITRTMTAALLALALCMPAFAKKKQPAQMFAGTYDWKQGGSDELKAEFTATGDNTWQVKFRFRWSSGDHNWKGTAEGGLEEGGKLTGTATSGSRKWVFEAEIKDGVMHGEHTEIQSGGERDDTGTFELKR